MNNFYAEQLESEFSNCLIEAHVSSVSLIVLQIRNWCIQYRTMQASWSIVSIRPVPTKFRYRTALFSQYVQPTGEGTPSMWHALFCVVVPWLSTTLRKQLARLLYSTANSLLNADQPYGNSLQWRNHFEWRIVNHCIRTDGAPAYMRWRTSL